MGRADADADAFLEACGSAGALRLVLASGDRPGAGARAFRRPFVVLGRDPAADLVLDHPEVSRRHAYLQLIGGRLFGVDLRSRTGTRWGGRRRAMGWVGPGDELGVGPFRVRLEGGPDGPPGAGAVPPPTSRAFEQPGLAEATLEFPGPEPPPGPWRVSRALVLLGRSPLCKVQLRGPGVSEFHAALVRTPGGTWAVDLLGRGGLLVNGDRVRSARLADGDELRIGPRRVAVRLGAAAGRPPGPLALPAGRSGGPLVPEVNPAFAAGLPEALLVPLLGELGQMQKQMAEQFQQSLVMMFRMFSSMHQDQMDLLREELGRIQELAEEQRSLQAALEKVPPAPAVRPALRLVSDGPRPAFPAAAPAGGEGPPRPPAAEAPGPAPGRARPAEAPFPEDLHATLARRLAAIQEERQGRWQKILGAVMGKGPPGA